MLSHINTCSVQHKPSSAYTNPHRLTHYTPLAHENTHFIWYSRLVTGTAFLQSEQPGVYENQSQQLGLLIVMPFRALNLMFTVKLFGKNMIF